MREMSFIKDIVFYKGHLGRDRRMEGNSHNMVYGQSLAGYRVSMNCLYGKSKDRLF